MMIIIITTTTNNNNNNNNHNDNTAAGRPRTPVSARKKTPPVWEPWPLGVRRHPLCGSLGHSVCEQNKKLCGSLGHSVSVNKNTPYVGALAIRFSGRDCSPVPNLLLWKLIFQRVFFFECLFLQTPHLRPARAQ